jgi:hypothetical protein
MTDSRNGTSGAKAPQAQAAMTGLAAAVGGVRSLVRKERS